MEKKDNRVLKGKLSRVDYQVSIIIAVIVSLSFLCVYIYNYQLTYNEMLTTLKERSDRIHEMIEANIDINTYVKINTKEDVDEELYKIYNRAIRQTREISGVKYLYTAKKNAEGKFVYVIDGLTKEDEDFKYPGDLVEKEMVTSMHRAMQNRIIYPKDIIKTVNGYIFASYYPIRSQGEVVGLVGIEFDAQRQYITYEKIRYGTLVIGFLFTLLAMVISVFVFRRISNPTFKDFANTDYLTGLKNRNAFELHMKNLEVMHYDVRSKIGIISVDLNDLKVINDTHGHQIGDLYIQECTLLLKTQLEGAMNIYRVGGDEFVALLKNCSLTKLEKMKEELLKQEHFYCEKQEYPLSIAIGCAIFTEGIDHTLNDVYRRADENMYIHKKQIKQMKVEKKDRD